MFLVDSHCHLNQLNYQDIHKNISDVLEKAYQQGVQLLLSVSTDFLDYHDMIKRVGYRKDVVFSCGVHPLNLSSTESFDRHTLYNLSSSPYVVAIGETGLDYYHNHHDMDQINIQKKAFRDHIIVARNINKPLIVHSRKAIADTITLLREEKAEMCSGVLHCFSENVDSVRSLLNINFYISFSGIVTFYDLNFITKVIRYTPIDRMLLETDAPYLTPKPYRGQENQPAYVYEIAKYIAHIKNVTIEHLAFTTTSNFHKLFRTSL